MKQDLLYAVFALAIVALPSTAAEPYPSKPIHLSLGFTPGASVDLTARSLAKPLGNRLNVPIIVENRPGAGGNLVFNLGMKMVPDGYNLVFNAGGIVQNYALQDKPAYHPLRDFTPVALVSKSPLLLVINTRQLPGVNNIRDFVAYAKANPGKLSYGSAGTGNITHLGPLLFASATGIKVVHVPYKGSAQALTDLVGGHLHFLAPTVATVRPSLKDGKVKPLALLALKRSSVLPDVPTAHETLAPNVEAVSWLGVIGPAKLPRDIVTLLNREINASVNDAEFKSKVVLDGSEPITASPEEYGAFLKVELERWTKTIKANNITLK